LQWWIQDTKIREKVHINIYTKHPLTNVVILRRRVEDDCREIRAILEIFEKVR